MVKKPDTWWDIWLPERVLTEQLLLDVAEKPTDINGHNFFQQPILVWDDGFDYADWRLTRTKSENLNRKISSGIDLGYIKRENNIPYISNYKTLYKKELNSYKIRYIII